MRISMGREKGDTRLQSLGLPKIKSVSHGQKKGRTKAKKREKGERFNSVDGFFEGEGRHKSAKCEVIFCGPVEDPACFTLCE